MDRVSPEPSSAKAECGVRRLFAVDKKNPPLMPCLPLGGRKLLRAGKAVVLRWFSFTIRSKEGGGATVGQNDSGAKMTGLAVIRRIELRIGELWLLKMLEVPRSQAAYD